MSAEEMDEGNKVVVVEDSPTQAMRLRADLESHGFDVRVTQSGREALETSRRERPDVILSDVLMPDMDGFRLCREIQVDAELFSIPVVLRTVAFVDEEDRQFALACGARAYVAKDVENGELASLLRRVAKGRPAKNGTKILEEQVFQDRYGERLLQRLVHEVAEVERSNESLEQMQQQLQGILDNSPMLIYVKDLDGRYILTNRHAQWILGLDPDEVIGRTDEDLAGSDLGLSLRAHDEHVVDRGTPINFEESFVHDDGAHTYLSTKFPLRDSNDSIYAICAISMDITERKRLEESLRRSQKLEAVGRLAGGIAHDFNNLLSIIQNYAVFASEDLADTDPRKDDIQEISAAAERGASLVRQLVTFSRDDFAASEPLQVNAVIEPMANLLRASGGKAVEIEMDLEPDLRLTAINTSHLEQILLNLVINARDAMPDGGRITVASSDVDLDQPTEVAGRLLPGGSYVRISVSDTGTGMSASTMEQIFDPFFTTKPEGKGTGLGLATVQGIVEGAGGYITVDSGLGRGTTFHIYLPAADASAITPEESEAEPTGTTAPGRTVLVVDDQAGIRRIIHRTLSREGYEVLTAASGDEAEELFRHHADIGLLITDVVMPGMAGTELADRLLSSKPALEVIYMSGFRGADQRRTLPGGAPFIQKPFSMDDLLMQVKLVMERPAGDPPRVG
ncbi:MAG: response regulator [Actinobacteria bacterium]|nr:response regulator [Actinomycetota bacterium]